MNAINTLWLDRSIPLLEHTCLQSWLNQGYTVRLHTYGCIDQLPIDVQVIDANKTLPEWETRQPGGYDLFRFSHLYRCGGTWLDPDVALLRPIPDVYLNSHNCSSTSLHSHHNFAGKPDLCYVRAPISSSLAGRYLMRWPEGNWAKYIRKLQLGQMVLPAAAFCPLPLRRAKKVFNYPPWRPISDWTVGVKLWSSELWRHGYVPGSCGKRNSLLWWLIRENLGVDLCSPEGYAYGPGRPKEVPLCSPQL